MIPEMNENPLISFIIPVYNRSKELALCLPAYQKLSYTNYEIIVVDNGSTDDTADTARKLGAVVYSYKESQNANACRNFGASMAHGDILVFIDSDVVPSSNVGDICVAEFNNSDAAAVVGTYTVRHRNQNISSRYKNFWIRHSYLRKAGDIGWIFGAVTAMRRDVFLGSGGFNTDLHASAGIDDIELGTRLSRAGHKITLIPRLEVEHLKYYDFTSLMRNQFERSAGFFKMAAAENAVGKALTGGVYNVYPTFIFSVVLSPVMLVLPKLSLFAVEILLAELLLVLVYIGMNFGFLRDFYSHYGMRSTLSAAGLLFADHLVCFSGVGYAAGLKLSHLLLRKQPSEDKKELPEV